MYRPISLVVLMLASCATGSDQSMKSIDTLMRDFTGNVPGASVLVVRDGKVVVEKSYGLADLEQNQSSSAQTHYRLASITKQFTAAAIVLLAERGTLRYDDPVRKYLPTLPASAGPITLNHLLTHTSGLIDYEDVMPADTTRQLKDADVLRLLETQNTLYFAPGTSYRYSNSGYALLALIVERVSGQSFAAFLSENIFEPLRMRTTVAHEEGVSAVPHRAFGYSRNGDHWRKTDQSLTSAVLGDGGIYTSSEDLVRWLAALDSGKFSVATQPRVDTDHAGVRYGYGWRTSEHRGHRAVWHTGETIGFRNALVRFPDDRLAVVILTNRDEEEPYKTALEIADLFLK